MCSIIALEKVEKKNNVRHNAYKQTPNAAAAATAALANNIAMKMTYEI